jgi:hypothetical protein
VLFTAIVLVTAGATAWVTHWIDRSNSAVPQLPSIVQIPFRQYDEREWPPLTDFQAAEWVRVLSPLHPSRIGIYWGQEVEARRLFRSIQEIGKQINCEVTANGGYADKPQITVHTRRKNNPVGPALVTLLTQYQQGGLSVPVTLEHPDNESSESEDNYKLGALIFLPECPQHQTPIPSDSPRRQVVNQRDSAERGQSITTLVNLLREGVQLQKRCEKNSDLPATELRAWEAKVHMALQKLDYGQGYVDRFDSADGSIEPTDGTQYQWVVFRNEALSGFIKELSAK